MKYEIIKIKEKTLVGLKARIKEEKTAHDTIWNLWKDLYSEKGVKNVKDRKMVILWEFIITTVMKMALSTTVLQVVK